MRVVEYRDLAQFQRSVEPFLVAREAENCVQLGVLDTLRMRVAGSLEPGQLAEPRLWTAEESDSAVAAVAMQVVDTSMNVTRGSDTAMACVADALASAGWSGKYLHGIHPSITYLVDRYATVSGQTASLFRSVRTFELREVIDPRTAPGGMLPCTESDRRQLEDWVAAFADEINEPVTPERHRALTQRLLSEQRAFFWVNQAPVAMAVWGGRTPNGRRVTLVYTPPAHRGHGYASNLVARLSRHVLETGSSLCFLHTDLANPNSNRIYQMLGYRPVCDSQTWRLAGATGLKSTESGRRNAG